MFNPFLGAQGGSSGNPELQQKQLMARYLMQNAGEQQSPTQLGVVARALQGALAGYAQNDATESAKARETSYNETMARALRAGSGQENIFDEKTGQWSEPTGKSDPQLMASVLAGNKDTAPMGMQFQMSNMQKASDREAALEQLKAKNALEPPKTREVKRDGKIVTEEFNPQTRSWATLAISPQWNPKDPEQGNGGPFAGKALEAQAMNILLQGNPGSPEYRAAYNHLASPRYDFATGTQINPDMSAYRPPGAAAPQAGLVGPQVAGAPGELGTPDPNQGGVVPGAQPIPGYEAKSTPEQVKMRTAVAEAATIVKALNDFDATVSNAGLGEKAQSVLGLNTPSNTAYNKAALLAKGEELFNLGVLNGPDLDIIRRTLPDPSTIRGAAGGSDAAKQAVKQVKELILTRLNAKERGMSLPFSTEMDLLRGLPKGQDSNIPPPPPGFVVNP